MKDDNKKVTETHFELFTLANADIGILRVMIESGKQLDLSDRILCTSHGQLAVEKMLKGYLRLQGKFPEWGHNLEIYNNKCIEIDNSFKEIITDIENLNKYTASRKYTLKYKIDDKEFEDMLKSLKNIYTHKSFYLKKEGFSLEKLENFIKFEYFDSMIERFKLNCNSNIVKKGNIINKKFSGRMSDLSDVKKQENKAVNIKPAEKPGIKTKKTKSRKR
jgi:HEPN domain-containing protein